MFPVFLVLVWGRFWPEALVCNSGLLFVLQGRFYYLKNDISQFSCCSSRCDFCFIIYSPISLNHLSSPTWLLTIYQRRTCWMCVCIVSTTAFSRWRQSSEWVSWSSGERCFPSREPKEARAPCQVTARFREDTSSLLWAWWGENLTAFLLGLSIITLGAYITQQFNGKGQMQNLSGFMQLKESWRDKIAKKKMHI